MLGLKNDTYRHGIDCLLDGVSDLGGQAFLQLGLSGKRIHDTGDLGKA